MTDTCKASITASQRLTSNYP